MKRTILTIFISIAALSALMLSGCAGKQAAKSPDVDLARIEAMIATAEAMEAVDCAPEELARAQAALDHARGETGETDSDPATYLAAAQKAAEKLLAKTKPCYEARHKKPAPELTVSVEPAAISSGDCAVLSWSAVNTEQVLLFPGGDNLSLDGTREVCPATATLYIFTATGSGGSVTSSVNLGVIESLADTDESQTAMTHLTPIYFDFDRDTIREDAKPVLEKLAVRFNEDRGLRLILEGHCDQRGTAEYNMALGERRAASTRRYLHNLGVPLSSLNTISYGEERPAGPGNDEAAWTLNRRVEFLVK